MYELPPDPERLRVIRIYLQQQLAAVDAKLKELEDRRPPGWRLEHIPSAAGFRGRGVLHRDDCWVKGARGGGKPHTLTREQAVLALTVPTDEIAPCDVCHPERDLAP